MKVLHISADYPDAILQTKTRAISALIEGTSADFDHRVYALNRRSAPIAWLKPGRTEIVDDNGIVASCYYSAPANGVWLARSMNVVAQKVVTDIKNRGFKPDAVHGHKLSFEGIAAHRIAQDIGIPFLITLQGNTDQKLLRARADLRDQYRRVWHEAAHVIAFSPWIIDFCSEMLGQRAGPCEALPCIPANDQIIKPRESRPVILTAFNFDDWRNKNIATLARAVSLVSAEYSDLTLEIAGSGNQRSLYCVRQIIDQHEIADRTIFLGQMASEDLKARMNSAAVFAMPSLRETFGMVFAEALLAGCPVVHAKGTAIAGYFSPSDRFAQSALGTNVDDIADALRIALAENAAIKHELAAWQSSPAAQHFRAQSILDRYSTVTCSVVAK